MAETTGDSTIITPEPKDWKKILFHSFRNQSGTGTEPHDPPPDVEEKRTAQQSPFRLAKRITALAQPPEEINPDVIAGRNVRAALTAEANAQKNAAESERLTRLATLNADKLNEENTAIMAQPPRLTTSEISNQSKNIKNPITRLIDDARAARMQPVAEPEATIRTLDIIKPAEQAIVKEVAAESTSIPEVPLYNPTFSQEFVDEMAQTAQGLHIGRNKTQLEEDVARTEPDIARQIKTTETIRRRLAAEHDRALRSARLTVKEIKSTNNETPIPPVSKRRLDNAVNGLAETPAERRTRVATEMGNAHVAQFGGPVNLTNERRAELAARAAEKANAKAEPEDQ